MVRTFEKLNSHIGLLEALFNLGNTLEMIYIGGMIYTSPQIDEKGSTLIPLYVEFKAKKCH